MCQSEVCSSFTSGSFLARGVDRSVHGGQNGGTSSAGSGSRLKAVTVGLFAGAGGAVAALGWPGRPRRERELDGERYRDLRLADEHGAGLGERGPGALAGRQEAVLRPAGLGGSSRPTTLMRGVATIRRSTSLAVCWAPIRMMPRRPAAFGDVQQHVLDRAVAFARCVLVQLVDHGEQQAAGPGRFLAGGLGGEHDADHEPLRPLPQVVQVDDGDLLVRRW